MTDKQSTGNGGISGVGNPGRRNGMPYTGRRPYAAPRILSSEELELAAAACEPSNAAFGKDFPMTCGQWGT